MRKIVQDEVATDKSQRAQGLELARDATVGRLIDAVFDECFRHISRNMDAALVSMTSETIHQLRVAIRRFRSAASLFDRVIDRERLASAGRDIKSLARLLGEARVYDVLLQEELFKMDGESFVGIDLAPLRLFLLQERNARYARIERTLRASKTGQLRRRLEDMVEGRMWKVDLTPEQAATLEKEGRAFALAASARLEQKVLRKGRGFRKLSTNDIHALRLSLKRLRYGTEFMASILPEADARYLRKLARLQDDLGRWNDRETNGAVLKTLLNAGAPQALHPAIGAVIGWQACEQAMTRDRLYRKWKRFRRAARFAR